MRWPPPDAIARMHARRCIWPMDCQNCECGSRWNVLCDLIMMGGGGGGGGGMTFMDRMLYSFARPYILTSEGSSIPLQAGAHVLIVRSQARPACTLTAGRSWGSRGGWANMRLYMQMREFQEFASLYYGWVMFKGVQSKLTFDRLFTPRSDLNDLQVTMLLSPGRYPFRFGGLISAYKGINEN